MVCQTQQEQLLIGPQKEAVFEWLRNQQVVGEYKLHSAMSLHIQVSLVFAILAHTY
jgi:hypothetical protein